MSVDKELNKVFAYILPTNDLDINKVDELNMLQVTTFETPRWLIVNNKTDKAISFIFINTYEKRFVKSGYKDYVAGMKAFVQSFNLNIYPPRSVLFWIAESFMKYSMAAGSLTMDEALFGSNRNKHNIFKKIEDQTRREKVVICRAKLVELAGIKPGVATRIVSDFFGGEESLPIKTIPNWISINRDLYDGFREFLSSRKGQSRIDMLTEMLDHFGEHDPRGYIQSALRKEKKRIKT